jgi:hypothetical protein
MTKLTRNMSSLDGPSEIQSLGNTKCIRSIVAGDVNGPGQADNEDGEECVPAENGSLCR